jgi:diaminopimelate decarboxylase
LNAFDYRNGRLHAEGVDLAALAEEVGTPCYVYSRAAIEAAWRAYDDALVDREHLVCYALKANSCLAVLDVLARLGSGFDVTSGGELERVLAAGGDPARVVFSGVGKTEDEMRRALETGIACFNVESAAELEALERVAGALGARAPVSLRVNPDVDPRTHPYVATGLRESKFGVPIAEAGALYRRAAGSPHLEVRGAAFHIGSGLQDPAPAAASLERVLALMGELMRAGLRFEHLDVGGGLGIRYADESPPEPGAYVEALLEVLEDHGDPFRDLRVIVEPGRSIVGNAGVLLTRVLYLKHGEARNFAVVDAAMNDLLRPALYQAWHDVVPVIPDRDAPARVYDVVGPVCESGDFLARARELALAEGDLLAVASAGAYAAVMASNYNSRPRAPEILVDGERYCIGRRRETVQDILALEQRLPED